MVLVNEVQIILNDTIFNESNTLTSDDPNLFLLSLANILQHN